MNTTEGYKQPLLISLTLAGLMYIFWTLFFSWIIILDHSLDGSSLIYSHASTWLSTVLIVGAYMAPALVLTLGTAFFVRRNRSRWIKILVIIINVPIFMGFALALVSIATAIINPSSAAGDAGMGLALLIILFVPPAMWLLTGIYAPWFVLRQRYTTALITSFSILLLGFLGHSLWLTVPTGHCISSHARCVAERAAHTNNILLCNRVRGSYKDVCFHEYGMLTGQEAACAKTAGEYRESCLEGVNFGKKNPYLR